jgi:RNA polymerase sigma-70 factor (ECF subfamily)
MNGFASTALTPEEQVSNSEIRSLLEKAVGTLPDAYRTVFVLRDIEDMSTTDTANALEISEENVKVRLHRARALLRKTLYDRAGMERKDAFNFHAVRCDRVVKNVFERIQKPASTVNKSAAKLQ